MRISQKKKGNWDRLNGASQGSLGNGYFIFVGVFSPHGIERVIVSNEFHTL